MLPPPSPNDLFFDIEGDPYAFEDGLDYLFGVLEAKRMAQSVAVTTEDGSLGDRGRVTDVLPALLSRTGSDVVYACGPMAMLKAVAKSMVIEQIRLVDKRGGQGGDALHRSAGVRKAGVRKAGRKLPVTRSPIPD